MAESLSIEPQITNSKIDIEQKEFLFTNKNLIFLFIPILIELFLEYAVGFADSIMVSHVGEAAVSGVSLVNFIMQLLISLFAAICTGGAVIAGQYLGKKDKKNSIQAADQLVWFVGILSAVIMIITLMLKSFIIGTLFGHISEEVRANSEIYYNIVIPSIPFLALINAGAAVYRTSGNSKLPMKIMLGVNSINVLGNAFLIYGMKMGTAGIAIPTLISRIAGAVILISLLLNNRLPLHIKSEIRHHFDFPMIARILRVGVPFGLENSLFFLGRLLVLSLVATLGTPSIAANSIALTLALFSVLPGMAINIGMTPVISQCIGAGDFEQARFYHKRILLFIYVSLIAINAVILTLLPGILNVYHLSETTYHLTYQLVFWHGVVAVLIWPMAYSQPVTFRSAGDARFPMLTATISMFICRILMSYIFVQFFRIGLFGTYLAMFMDWVVKAIIFTVRYISGRWMRFKLI